MTIEGHIKAQPFVDEYNRYAEIKTKLVKNGIDRLTIDGIATLHKFNLVGMGKVKYAIIEMLDHKLDALKKYIEKID